MKKAIKALTAVLVLATLCLGLLAGCANNSFTGHWKAISMTVQGVEMDVSGMDITLDIREDGTATSRALGVTTDMTWTKINDTSFTMQTSTYTLKDNQLYVESDDGSTSMILAR